MVQAEQGDASGQPAGSADDGSQLVVIGSSAGGIDALSTIVQSLPPDTPVPILVAQHLNPHRPSHLPEILQRHSKLPVVAVDDHARLRPGNVFVLPEGSGAEITDNEVRLVPIEPRGPNPSVDLLLTTAAHAFGEGLIAVILTGTGSDGAIGARDVKVAGGTVIVQNPATASYPGMPNAIAPTAIDIVAELDAIGPLIHDLVTGSHTPNRPDDERLLHSFLDELRERTGIDFNSYKRATILRRLQRRMAATDMTTLRDYVRFVRANPDEFQRLTSSFLIKVTQFFRDSDLFDHLRETIVPELIEQARQGGRELRIWSAGCATGEEAYSLAILFAEALGDELDDFDVRIFATDVDLDAITFARRGVYPAAAVADLPAEIIERHFVPSGDDYEIRKRIRAMTIFGQHDLGQRAPFPRVDLALCRNVLIYFTAELQRRALQLFAFSLRDGGYLVLGKAETTTPLAEYFVLAHPRLKIFRRQGDRVLIPPTRIRDALPQQRPMAPRRAAWTEPVLGRVRDAGRGTTAAESAEALLLRLPVGVVVVDRRYDIQSINAAARRMLSIHGPAIGEDVVHLVPAQAAEACRSVVDAALRGETAVAVVEVPMPAGEEREVRAIELSTQPFATSNGGAPIGSVVLITHDVTNALESRRELERAVGDETARRERLAARTREIAASQAELLEANQQLTTANAELRSANEELVVANEEVQAATEEVETLNEELQATNEELETLNEELQATVEELNTTNDDLEARSVELQESAAKLEGERARAELDRSRMERLLDRIEYGIAVYQPDRGELISNARFREVFAGDARITDESGAELTADLSPRARAARGERFEMRLLCVADGNPVAFDVRASELGADDPGYTLLEMRRVQ